LLPEFLQLRLDEAVFIEPAEGLSSTWITASLLASAEAVSLLFLPGPADYGLAPQRKGDQSPGIGRQSPTSCQAAQ